MIDKPKLSVAVTVYNLEQYIEETIQSILDQKADFEYDIVIGDDCSEDNSQDILHNLKYKFPNKIKLLLNKKNLGAQDNLINVIKHCNGEYIAIMDGDDFWVDPFKLQKELDLLESHPSYSMCATAGKQYFEHDKSKNKIFRAPGQKNSYSIEDILQDNFILTSTVVFRRKYLDTPPKGYNDFPYADWPLWVNLAKKGPIGYIDEVMSGYRIHSSNIYGTLTDIEKIYSSLKARKTMIEYLEKEYHKYCYHSIYNYNKKLMYKYRKIGNAPKVREHANKSLKLIKYYQSNSLYQLLILLYHCIYTPSFYKYTYPIIQYLKKKINI